MSRRRARTEVVYGRHPVEGLLERDPLGVVEIWMAEGARAHWLTRLRERAGELGTPVQEVARTTLDRLSGRGVHQGVVVRYRATAAVADSGDALLERMANPAGAPPLVLLLDGVEDPRNLGACVRSAAAAGADAVVVPRSRGAVLTPEARKAAAGAAEVVLVHVVANLARYMTELSDAGLRLVGTAGEAGQSLYDTDLRGPIGLVLGSEGRGLRRLTRERCDELAAIPMASSMASLNVSVAAGVCLFEACRQRRNAPASGNGIV